MAMDFGTGAGSSQGSRRLLATALRATLAGSVAVAALLTASIGPAAAATDTATPTAATPTAHKKPVHARRQEKKNQEAKKKEPPPKPLEMPLIEVSIADQRLTIYDKGEVIAHAPVSTGMAGHLTPTGVFSVLEKEVFHRSNIYSGAPMPFMQRITWSGVAMHAGVLPGSPASHGGSDTRAEFAVKLFHMPERGARVLVVRNEVTPEPIESPRLFTRPKPTDKVSVVVPAPAAPKPLVRTAQTPTPNLMTDAVEPSPHAAAATAAPKPAEAPAAAPAPTAAPATAAMDTGGSKDTLTDTARAAANDAVDAARKEAAAPPPAAAAAAVKAAK